MSFKPLGDRVAIETLSSEEKTSGGIIIPDTAKEKPLQGKVIAVGDGTRDQNGNVIPLTVKTGDIVIYGKYSTTEVKIDGKEIVVVKESDLMGIIV